MCDENKKLIQEAKEQWTAGPLNKMLSRGPERREQFTTSSDFPVDNIYTPLDAEESKYLSELGMPGSYPFTRGVYSTMYRGRFWTMRQYAGMADAAESNKRYKYLLEQGQTGLSVAFDLPTQIGYDSDHSLAEGEVGKVGVAIDSLADMETLFDGIPLDKVSTSMTINAPASVLLAMYICVAEKQGVGLDKIAGTIQNDILKEYIARGTYIYPPKQSMRLITNIFEYCSQNVPRWNTISISGYHIREAGSSAAQEVAFTIADAIAYVEAALEAGLEVDKFASRLSFFFNSHLNFIEEIAKFRAARRLWAKLMKDRFHAKKDKSMMLRFHTQTGGSTLTAQQPDNNIIRVTLQALAAVLGGTQSLHTNSKDEALALPTEESVRIALRTQQIIAYESGVADTPDPLGGSYYLEALTKQIEDKAMEYITKIDEMGGAVKAIELGYIQQEIADSAYNYQMGVEADENVIVGVNKFTVKEAPPENLLKISDEVQVRQINRLHNLKTKRNNDLVTSRLEDLRKAAEGTDNLMPYIISAVKEYATLGEICGVLREVFGEYRPAEIL
ncbi:methylmalonyl-CoA mutase family protein [Clostridium sp. 'deep sea']|uniref:acyl-CoA mutase large subunit family protein n=1 Tax=Clostridium sp. 'deep sea' TaxID=2779445 RepID=UPI001896A39B|nr:methylmalonyl-CoA mutase family protein [Clostridium sp. 'deep sea']QOR35787.1 methylmalonyl-CoA mutase family protein [Clostridium sp. 'deep sea']